MPRVNFVKKARKDNPAVKAGESYYWWKFRYGGMHYSKTYPKSSQLTQSEFLSGMYSIEEDAGVLNVDDARDAVVLEDFISDAVSRLEELRDLSQDSLDNIPDGLREGPTGQMLEGRVDECDSMIDQYEAIDLDDYDGPEVSQEDGEIPEEFSNWIEGKLEEIQQITYGGE